MPSETLQVYVPLSIQLTEVEISIWLFSHGSLNVQYLLLPEIRISSLYL
jgi:hypothetical protein